MDELEQRYEGKVEFETIDVGDYDVYSAYQQKYDLQVIPTVLVLDGSGEVVLSEVSVRDVTSYRNNLIEALDMVSGQT